MSTSGRVVRVVIEVDPDRLDDASYRAEMVVPFLVLCDALSFGESPSAAEGIAAIGPLLLAFEHDRARLIALCESERPALSEIIELNQRGDRLGLLHACTVLSRMARAWVVGGRPSS